MENIFHSFNCEIIWNILRKRIIHFISYDILGKEVATLVNEEKTAGSYEVQFNSHSGEGWSAGGGLTSGIYFYRLQAGDYTETKKMILLK